MGFLNKLRFKDAFTLIELMVVVTLIGIATAFAIPSYQKAMEKAYERRAIGTLQLFNAANEAYLAKYGVYPAVNDGDAVYDLDWINITLGLQIPEDDRIVFRYIIAGPSWSFKAIRSDDGGTTTTWGLRINIDSATNSAFVNQVCCDTDNYDVCPATISCT